MWYAWVVRDNFVRAVWPAIHSERVDVDEEPCKVESIDARQMDSSWKYRPAELFVRGVSGHFPFQFNRDVAMGHYSVPAFSIMPISPFKNDAVRLLSFSCGIHHVEGYVLILAHFCHIRGDVCP